MHVLVVGQNEDNVRSLLARRSIGRPRQVKQYAEATDIQPQRPSLPVHFVRRCFASKGSVDCSRFSKELKQYLCHPFVAAAIIVLTHIPQQQAP